jgi:cytochrome c-type biogenesis protein CcmF
VLAHVGTGVTVIGISAAAWSVESIATLKTGDSIAAGPYEARLERVIPRTGSNYREDAAVFTVSRSGRELGQLETMKRLYLTRNMPTTEAGIMTVGLSQVYVSIGDAHADESFGIRLYYKPLILMIWIGALFMAAGATLSLTDRRLRVGAPVKARSLAPVPAPAE